MVRTGKGHPLSVACTPPPPPGRGMPFRILSLKQGLHIDVFASGTFWMGNLHVVVSKVYLTKRIRVKT